MKILIDGQSLQARVHISDGRRLESFLAEIGAVSSAPPEISPSEPLESALLGPHDVLVIATRGPEPGYTSKELRTIHEYVGRGGGLLLMSNHGDLPGRNEYDWRKHDSVLALEFGIEIECSWFANPEQGKLSEISGSALLDSHPIIRGASGEKPVRNVHTNNCCSIVSSAGAAVAAIPDSMVDMRNGLSPQGRCFACALEAADGRVLAVADSGFIGSDGTTRPGPGLIGRGDNARFIRNAVRWLAGELS